MTMHAVVGRLGPSDTTPVDVPMSALTADLDLLVGDRRLGFGITTAIEDLAGLGMYPSEAAVDLLVLAIMIQAADTRVSRRTTSQDSWTRELAVRVPVHEPDRWEALVPLLERTLKFLTGDIWSLRFHRRLTGHGPYAPVRPLAGLAPPFDCISLFSGGMDSLIGAIDLLHSGQTPLLVSHAGDGVTSNAQAQCFASLKEKYQSCQRFRSWISIHKAAMRDSESETSTRGRSFLFFALAAFAASGMNGATTIVVPENGLISLNVPLDPLRLGSLSTRTTHPFYMARWAEILRALDIRATLHNPYRYRTKGEMALECKDQELFAKLLPFSMSCSSPTKSRYSGVPPEHCGFCVPCLIRRAALQRASILDPGPYTLRVLTGQTLNSSAARGQQVRAFQLATARVMATPELAAILIHKPGPLRDDAAHLAELADVYRRGSREVHELLSSVVTAPS